MKCGAMMCWHGMGGEEFIACLPETSLDDALKIAERLRHKIENIVVNLEHGHRLDFTVPIGAAILERVKRI